jgi:hypothetical protein
VNTRLAIGLSLAAVLALPGAASAQAPTGDSVVGTLLAASGEAALIDAHSGPSGENPSGTARFGTPDSTFAPLWELDVTCLSVDGHTALIGFSGTVATIFGFGELYPTAGLIRVVDGGGPASGKDSVEFVSVEGPIDGPTIPGPTTCSAYPGAFPLRHGPITNSQRDLQVTDVQPFPTTKDECKNGGWRNYGTFKNQGDCVSFVATGGKNQPAGSKKP